MTTDSVIKRIGVLASNLIPKDGNGPYVVFNPSNWYDYTTLWGGYTNMLPFEGYLRGYRYDITQSNKTGNNNPYKINVGEPASFLNMPEFSVQFFNDIQSGDFSKSSYIFLNTFPFNPPVGMEDGQSEITAAYLFKNSAGNYSIPTMYQYWLGGMWKYRKTNSEDNFVTDIFLQTRDNNTAVTNILDVESFSDNPIYSNIWYNATNKRMVFDTDAMNVFRFYSYLPLPTMMLLGPNSSITPPAIQMPIMNGLGIFSSLISSLFPFFNNSDNLALNSNGKKTLNIKTVSDVLKQNLRVYTSYFWLNQNKINTTMVSHGVYGIGNYVANNESQFIMKNDDPFGSYCSAWKYCNTQYISHRAGLNITDEKLKSQESITFSIKSLNAVIKDDDINIIINYIFKELNVTNHNDPLESWTYSFSGSTTNFSDYLISVNSDPRKVLMEFIANDVLQMNENFIKYALNDSDLDSLGVTNKDFYCVLYPSAGGTYWQPSLVHDTNGFKNGHAYPIENAILNSCKLLWYTGPSSGTYVNSLDTSVNNSVELGHFISMDMLFNNREEIDLYPKILSNLDRSLFFNFYEFYDNTSELRCPVTKDDRTYVISSELLWLSNQKNYIPESPYTPIPVNSVVDYLGTGFLDVCEEAYNQPSTKNLLLNSMLSLMVIDKDNLEDVIIVDGVEYKKDAQIEILTKYNAYLDVSYLLSRYNEVINVSLSRAQANKAKKVINALLAQRDIITIGSVLDSIDSNGIRNGMINQIITDPENKEWSATGSTVDMGKYIRKNIFGNATIEAYSTKADRVANYAKYIFRDPSDANNYVDIDPFYITINVAPTFDNIRISCEYARLYYNTKVFLKTQNPAITANRLYIETLTSVYNTIYNMRLDADKQIDVYMSSLSAGLKAAYDAKVESEKKSREEEKKSQSFLSDDLLKTKTYYNIKALYDNWISMGFNGGIGGKINKMNLFFNYNTVTSLSSGNWIDNQSGNRQTTLYEQFLFVDRGSRNIGKNLLVNINWLNEFMNNNANAENFSIYSFFSELAKRHSCLLHTLPFFITFDGTLNASKSANDLFDTFDSDIIVEKKPKFIFQFIGNVTSELNTPSNYSKRTKAKSWHIGACPDKSGGLNEFPIDMQSDASALAFIVDFGAQNQQIFSNLQLDQSEFQNTEEYFKLITDITSNGPQINSNDLFAIFSSRSYTAQIDCMGNMMIQPLMYFDLTNIPLFDGTYWITNVKHTITPNNIKTSFKGVRQPIATIPLRGDVLAQLVDKGYNDYLDIPSRPSSVTTTSPSELNAIQLISIGGQKLANALNKLPDNTPNPSFLQIFKFTIGELEGGYWHPNMLKDGRADDPKNMYRNSKETMFGIDRGSYNEKLNNVNVNKFWSLIDATNAAKPLKNGGWKWNYIPTLEKTNDGKLLVDELKNLAILIMEYSYNTMKNNYLNLQSKSIVEQNAKLNYYFGNATWNGAGWFKSFAETMNECVMKGNLNPQDLLKKLFEAKINNRGLTYSYQNLEQN